MSIFEALYDLSIRLLKAPPKSELGRLTLHHCHSTAEAEALVRAAVLTREMPGEVPTTRWGILRVFMRNLVNRSQPAMTAQAMLRCLNEVASLAHDEALRTGALVNAVAGNAQLNQSLQAVLNRDRAPDGYNDYLDWLSARIEEYRQMPVAEINTDRVLNQLRHIAVDRKTKIPNMGIALASNLFADLGVRVVGKPDLHVLPTVETLRGVGSLTPEECIREVIRISQEDAPLVAASGRFNWLTGGLYPRDLDRMIYLIGSDNFRLNGTQQKRGAPTRRALMLNALIDASRAVSQTRAPQPPESGSMMFTATRSSPDCEMPTMAHLPLWLHDWGPGRPVHVEDFFASRVVFYPGSGTDGQPVQFFGSRHAAHCFVFADYGITMDHVLRELGEAGHPFAGYQSAGRVELSERDLTPSGWVPHIQPQDAPRGSLAPGGPYGFIEVLERRPGFDDTHGPKRLAILFLCADGVAAYDALFCQVKAKPPFAIVLQDHVYGGNWTWFGRGGSLEQLASTTQRLPEFLLVAENTDAWAGYSVIEGAVATGGGMHGFERQLWRRDHQLGNTSTAPQALPAEQSKDDSPSVDVQPAPGLPAQDSLPAAGDAPRPSARELFFSSIENVTAANALVARVIAACEVLHVRHHHTYTNGGDLRVEPDRPTPHPRQQNVITMAWVPTKGYFSCQALLSPNECIEQGLPPDGVRPNAAPLSSRLNVRPGIDDEAFLSVVGLSIQRFRGL